MATNEVRAIGHAAVVLLVASGLRAGTTVIGRIGAPEGNSSPPTSDLAGTGSSSARDLLATSQAKADTAALRSSPLAPGERVDPNTASAVELDRLPGIGPALASRIVAARAEGPFRSVEDLERVPGIGPRSLARLRDRLELAAAPMRRASRRRSTGPVGSGPANTSSVPRGWAISTMTEEDWLAVDGVGPVLAARIVEFRARSGGLERLDALLAVKGIGPSTLERIRRSLDRIRAGG